MPGRRLLLKALAVVVMGVVALAWPDQARGSSFLCDYYCLPGIGTCTPVTPLPNCGACGKSSVCVENYPGCGPGSAAEVCVDPE
jgi:hypothetical protein